MAKLFFLILFVFSFSVSFSQEIENLNGYKFIYVAPLIDNSGSIDKFQICTKAKEILEDKGFSLINNINIIPEEGQQNPCLILNCNLSYTYDNTAGIKVTIQFRNCKNELVYRKKGTQFISNPTITYFSKATVKAMSEISKLKYTYNIALTPEIKYPEVEVLDIKEEVLRKYYTDNKNNLDPIEGIFKTYQDENTVYYKLGIKRVEDKFFAIVLETDNKIWKAGEVKAIFEPTSVKGIYSVKFYMAYKAKVETFAVIDNDFAMTIEFNENNKKSFSKMIKMYPESDKGFSPNKIGVKSSGSGFILTTTGLVATNAHVIEGAKEILIKIENEFGIFNYKAKIELKDAKNDVAILRIADESFKGFSSIPYSLIQKAEIGEKVFTIGYPLNDIMGKNFKLTDGIISSNSGIADDIRFFQITVPLQPGNSGGPLFNKDGNIVGIATSKLNPNAVGTSIENVNYAIKITYLINLLEMTPLYLPPKFDNQLKGKELNNQVKILKNYVCLIEVSN